jgi:hypothetical protein
LQPSKKRLVRVTTPDVKSVAFNRTWHDVALGVAMRKSGDGAELALRRKTTKRRSAAAIGIAKGVNHRRVLKNCDIETISSSFSLG